MSHNPISNIAIVNVDLVLSLPHNYNHLFMSDGFKPLLHTDDTPDGIAESRELFGVEKSKFVLSGLLPTQSDLDTVSQLTLHTHNDSEFSVSFNTDLQYPFHTSYSQKQIAEYLTDLHLAPEYAEQNFKFKDIIVANGIEPEYGLGVNEPTTFNFSQVFDDENGNIMVSFIIRAVSVNDAWSKMQEAKPDDVLISPDKPSSSEMAEFSELTLTSIVGSHAIYLYSISSSMDSDGNIRHIKDLFGNGIINFVSMPDVDKSSISQSDISSIKEFFAQSNLDFFIP